MSLQEIRRSGEILQGISLISWLIKLLILLVSCECS